MSENIVKRFFVSLSGTGSYVVRDAAKPGAPVVVVVDPTFGSHAMAVFSTWDAAQEVADRMNNPDSPKPPEATSSESEPVTPVSSDLAKELRFQFPDSRLCAQVAARLDELDHWKAEAMLLGDMWEAAWERVQPLDNTVGGEYKSKLMADEILKLRERVTQLEAEVAKFTDAAEVRKAFYDLTVAQRDGAWHEVEVLKEREQELLRMVGVRADQLDKIEATLPDDDTGKVSIEQLVATYNIVHAHFGNATPNERALLDYLRSVKPT